MSGLLLIQGCIFLLGYLMLQAAKRLGEVDRLCLLVEELGGLEKIEGLQTHDNNIISQAALHIIEKYFLGEVHEVLLLLV